MSAGSVLVIDDDPQIRRAMKMTLPGHGYVVGEARTGEEGLKELRSNVYDLVLLDMNKSGMGGIETCRLIRCSSEIAVIMLTVSNTEKNKVDALDAGADDYVTKPFVRQNCWHGFGRLCVDSLTPTMWPSNRSEHKA